MTFIKALLTLFCLALFSFTVRYAALDSKPLWYDEAFTAGFCDRVIQNASYPRGSEHRVSPDSGEFYLNIAKESFTEPRIDALEHPAGYYLVACLARTFGPSPTTLRTPSAVFSALSIFLIALLAVQVRGVFSAVAVSVLLGASVYHLNYATDARSYSQLLFLVTLEFLSLSFVIRSAKILSLQFVLGLAGVFIAGVFAAYTHYLGLVYSALIGFGVVLYLGARTVTLLFRRKPRYELGEVKAENATLSASSESVARLFLVLVTLGMIAAASFPVILTMIEYKKSSYGAGIHFLSLRPEVIAAVVRRWGGGPYLTLPLLGLFLLGFVSLLRRFQLLPFLFLVWVTFPFLFFGLKPFGKFFDVRFVITALPCFFLIVSFGLDSLSRCFKRRSVGYAVTALFLLTYLGSSYSQFVRWRALPRRCSDFYVERELLEIETGFCKDELLLNTLIPEHQWILQEVQQQ